MGVAVGWFEVAESEPVVGAAVAGDVVKVWLAERASGVVGAGGERRTEHWRSQDFEWKNKRRQWQETHLKK